MRTGRSSSQRAWPLRGRGIHLKEDTKQVCEGAPGTVDLLTSTTHPSPPCCTIHFRRPSVKYKRLAPKFLARPPAGGHLPPTPTKPRPSPAGQTPSPALPHPGRRGCG